MIDKRDAPVWTVSDPDGKRLGQSPHRPSASELPEDGVLTVDYPSGIRRSWRVRDGRLIDEADLLRRILAPPNPALDSPADSRFDERVVYIAHDRSTVKADRVVAYDHPGEVPGGYAVCMPLNRLLMVLRHPHPPLCRWWRLDHAERYRRLEVLDVVEEANWWPRSWGAPKPRRHFLRFGNEWIRLTRDRETNTLCTYSTDGWLKVFCEGPMPDGWVLAQEEGASA